ncbi:hypothetical protein [Rhizobium sp. RM]|uniref:hypothetical protein n=1 Tax=Rhizobium sp. RM TaxID=2748079 RepID=UPI00110ED673|nr:hypothetical protein [Rhizobium sp. RM]NWJ26116.1 hypothetical protein [Rhizobium sp. RM]TMV20711.1 hypothetical protein BJG94_08425 [Rhizobium sp. Td3]
MNEINPPPSLRTLELLITVVKKLVDNKGDLTRTWLKRYVCDNNDELVDTALKYGYAKKLLVSKKQGYIGLAKGITQADAVIGEESYYPEIERQLKLLWQANNYSSSEYIIENTARRNAKIVGPWTRPDLTLVSHKKFPYTIGHEFDVVTFEVKRPDSSNVLAVFEALSHTSAATKAYVVFPISPNDWTASAPEQEIRVKDECAKHGVGLILIEDISTSPKPHHVIKARRKEIDHERSSAFLSAVLTPQGKEQIAKWK